MNKSEYQNPKSETNSNDRNTKFKIVSNFVLRISNFKFQAGQSLIELMVTIGLAAVLLPALLTGFVATRSGRAQAEQRQQAIALVREGQEVVRVFREADWTTFAVNGTYHPAQSGSTWILTAVPAPTETINGFTRQITISDACRNGGNIVVCTDPSAILDPSMKQVVTKVSWTTPIAKSVSATEYLTRNGNTTFVDTTTDDFNHGTIPVTIAVDASIGDGAVKLGPGVGGGDWCNPLTNVVATYDLTHSGVPIAITAATLLSQDLAYTTTGNNASGNSVDKLTISHGDPIVVENPNFNNEAKAYGIFTDGEYVYFNENNPPNHTVRIAKASDLSNLGSFDPEHEKVTGKSIYVSGNTGYTVGESLLYSFDVTSKSGTRFELDKLGLAGTGNRVVVVGTKAYVATSNPTNQLQIINVTNPASMNVVKNVNLGNGQAGIDVFIDPLEKYAYVVTTYSAGKNDFFIVDLNDTTKIWGYTTNGMNPKGITIPVANRAIIVGAGGEEYQVFDITQADSAFHCGGMTPAGVTSINAVSSVLQGDGETFSYIITDNASAEFQIIRGGAGGPGGLYASQGEFESQTFNAGHDVAFNYFSVNTDLPSGTSITFEIAIKNKDPISGSCPSSGYGFVSIAPGAILLPGTSYANPGQCLRYKANLFSNPAADKTPILYDITFNYSP